MPILTILGKGELFVFLRQCSRFFDILQGIFALMLRGKEKFFQHCETNGWFFTYKIVVSMCVISLFTYKKIETPVYVELNEYGRSLFNSSQDYM